MPTADEAARQTEMEGRIAAARQPLDTQTPELDAAQIDWERTERFRIFERTLVQPNVARKSRPASDAVSRRPVPLPGELPDEIAVILTAPSSLCGEPQRRELSAYFRARSPELQPARDRLAALEHEKAKLIESFPRTLVTTAAAPRTVRVLVRGNWQDDSGEIVAPAVPHVYIAPLDVTGRRANRLDLARWLVGRKNPLVARVLVNRLWRLLV